MRSNLPFDFNKNFVVGILVGLILGCLVGFLIFSGGKKSSSPNATVGSPDQPNPLIKAEEVSVCPCKSWSLKTLEAPEWRDDLDKKAELKTDFHGRISLRWKGVEGTRYYIVYYEDEKGRQLKTKNSGSESIMAGDIPLGEGVAEAPVLISVAAANAKKEPGLRSKKLKVLVRAPVNTVAPMIKDIKVEE